MSGDRDIAIGPRLSQAEAFELHDLLANLPGVRLLLAGLDVAQAAHALSTHEVLISRDWDAFRAVNELFPGLDREKRHRDEVRLAQAMGVLDRELAKGKTRVKNYPQAAIIRDAVKRLAGLCREPRQQKRPLPLEAKILPSPTGRPKQRRIDRLRDRCGLPPVPVQVANLAEN